MKTGTVQEHIKACIDASPAIVQGMAYAAAMKGQKFSTYVKQSYGRGGKGTSKPTCFKCRESGHMQRQYPGNNKSNSNKRSAPPVVSAHCQEGKHWNDK